MSSLDPPALVDSSTDSYLRPAMLTSRTNAQWLDELAAAGSRQSAALETLRTHLIRVLPAALRRFGDVPDHLIEDVVQEALVRALDKLSEFEGRSRFTTWVTTIAVRVAMTEMRRRRWKDVSLDELVAGDLAPRQPIVADQPDPEAIAVQSSLVRVLHDVVDQGLSERQRAAIVAELQGMPQEEIGRRLGLNRNAVYKLGHDARKKIKRTLEASGFDASEIRAAFP